MSDTAVASSGAEASQGLSAEEVAARLDRFGFNELPPPRRETIWRRAARQLAEPMSFLLIAAAAVTWLGLKKNIDAGAILVIVIANVAIALIQEGKAANALQALRGMESPTATVMRDGKTVRLTARELVPGDRVLLSAGERVPADIELIEAIDLQIDESMLTGESLPVPKHTDGSGEGQAFVFAGTLVVRGTGTGLVAATGRQTQLGEIAKHLEEKEPATPLQRELKTVTSRLGLISLVIAGGVFGFTVLRLGTNDHSLETAFLSAAALAVAAVPEGLPTVVTVTLALGVRRMAGRGSIVRRLPAVETLGSTTVILTDKTGTLTENRMALSSVWMVDGEWRTLDELPSPGKQLVSEVLALCNDATLDPQTGDPMEVALLAALGPERVEELRADAPRIHAVPFDSQRKFMQTVNRAGTESIVFEKGAPEVVLRACADAVDAAGSTRTLNEEQKQTILERAEDLASRGSRVLALARGEASAREPADEMRDLTFVGLVGLRDPVRSAAARAVADAAAAGIRILMVTGDHPGTAVAIAHEVGLTTEDSDVIVGADIKRSGLPADPLSIPVYARVDPDEKLALTQALQDRGQVVAVTGDGVNDAPALRRADIGVAMGGVGSDVAREAADMVVTDDNLATIVDAVREGRGIYDNIRKVVEYLVAGNLSEILVVVGGLLLFPGLGVPLLPLQLLWINLLTDGFPALALSVDPVDPTLMSRTPRSRADQLLSARQLRSLLSRAVVIAGAALASLAIARFAWNEPWPHARASMFSVLMTAHLLYAFVVRLPGGKLKSKTRVNPWLVGAVFGGLMLQAGVVSIPGLESIFGTAPLKLREWLLVLVAGTSPVVLIRSLIRART